MKMMTRLSALIMALIMVVICFAGCGKEEGNKAGAKGNTASDLTISYWNSGYGSEWLEDTVKRFEKAYPEYSVTLNMTASASGATASFGMAEIDDTDLYLATAAGHYLENLEPLNDILEMKAKGEDVPLKDKIPTGALDKKTFDDGNFYSVGYISGGSYNMVYNKKIFKDYGITQLPRTTNELMVVEDTLHNNGIPALVSFNGTGYWGWANYVWYSQYEGQDYYYNNFFACKDPKTGESPSKEVLLKKDGRYEIIKALEGVFKPEYVLDGSNSLSHTIMQTHFVQGKAAMMYNGGWLENEAASAGTMENFGIFRLPLISSITNKLTTVKSEVALRHLITAVDNVIDGIDDVSKYKSGNDYKVDGNTVSAADWAHIEMARRTTYGGATLGNSCFIPKYSTAKDAAKAFIVFINSDANVKRIAEEFHYTAGIIDNTKLDIDYSSWSELAKEFFRMESTYSYRATESDVFFHEIFTDGGASMNAGVDYLPHFYSKNQADRWTADQVWQKITDSVNSKYLPAWLANIK